MTKTSAAPCRRRSCPVHLRFAPKVLDNGRKKKKALSKVPHIKIPEMHVPLLSTKGESPKPHSDKPELLLQTSSDISKQVEVECSSQGSLRICLTCCKLFQMQNNTKKECYPTNCTEF